MHQEEARYGNGRKANAPHEETQGDPMRFRLYAKFVVLEKAQRTCSNDAKPQRKNDNEQRLKIRDKHRQRANPKGRIKNGPRGGISVD